MCNYASECAVAKEDISMWPHSSRAELPLTDPPCTGTDSGQLPASWEGGDIGLLFTVVLRATSTIIIPRPYNYTNSLTLSSDSPPGHLCLVHACQLSGLAPAQHPPCQLLHLHHCLNLILCTHANRQQSDFTEVGMFAPLLSILCARTHALAQLLP